MNIFYLHDDPIIAASMHCDQHLGKMILESAQMLSTIAWLDTNISETVLRRYLYKPTHQNHPCVSWLRESSANQRWLMSLCSELDNIRLSLGKDNHASSDVLTAFNDLCLSDISSPENGGPKQSPAIFCGTAIIGLNNSYPTVPDKYQAYYLHKAKRWALDGKARMSYAHRSIPDFMLSSEYLSTIR